MSEEEQQQPRPLPGRQGYMARRTIRDSNGRTQESFIMDPYGARYHHPGDNPQIDEINDTYGAGESKYIILGHIEPKERETFYAYYRAWAALASIAQKVPSHQGLADFFYEAYVGGPAKISMGVGGAAVTSENTNRQVNITQEQKKSRWRLR